MVSGIEGCAEIKVNDNCGFVRVRKTKNIVQHVQKASFNGVVATV